MPSAISVDTGLTLIENAPWGVIASVTPSTNPAATIINNAISMISGGNAVVFAPHPAAKRITQETLKMLNKAISEETGVTNLLHLGQGTLHRIGPTTLHLPRHQSSGGNRR